MKPNYCRIIEKTHTVTGVKTFPAIILQNFFARDTLKVCSELLGKEIVRRISDGKPDQRFLITEVEAYDGPEDQASHARFGPTPRARIMFGQAGVIYIYKVYGIHLMLNIITREEGYPSAILIRGTREVQGPGRLTKALQLDMSLNGKLARIENGLWFENSAISISPPAISRHPRIGIDYAGPVWSKKLYRFRLES